MAELQIAHRKSNLVFSARFPVVKDAPVLLLNQPIISWGRREMSAIFSGYTAHPATQFRNFFPYARRQASGASSPLLRPKGGRLLVVADKRQDK